MSTPAVVPHYRPVGSWPQFLATLGAGLGKPWPVIGFPAAAVVAEGAAAVARSVDPPAPHAARRTVALTTTTRRKIRGIDVCLLELERLHVNAGRDVLVERRSGVQGNRNLQRPEA